MNASRTPCSDLRHEILEHVGDLVYVTDQTGRCAVALPLPDNLGSNVEVYVEEPKTSGTVLVHDDAGAMLRYREAGYDWGDSPNDDKLVALLESYGVQIDLRERAYVECPRSQLADCVWKMGRFLTEATQLANLARPQFRYNFRRAVRDDLVHISLAHEPYPSFKIPGSEVSFDFEIRRARPILLNALSAASISQAKSVIAKSFMVGSLLRKYRERVPVLHTRRFTVTYDEDSEIDEVDSFTELSDVLDYPAIPGSEFIPTVKSLVSQT